MTKPNCGQYVHEIMVNGVTRYVVAEYVSHREYHVPMTPKERELYGGHTWVCASLEDVLSRFGSWPTRKQALRRARYLFVEMER